MNKTKLFVVTFSGAAAVVTVGDDDGDENSA